MPFQRKAGLGHYSGTKPEWLAAYQKARIDSRRGEKPNPATEGVEWKAQLIVAYERNGHLDKLSGTARQRLAAKKLIDEIVGTI